MDAQLSFLLELYRAAQAIPVTEFQDFAFDMLRTIVPFRTATWSEAEFSPQKTSILSVHLHDEPPEMLSEFTALNCQYTQAVASCARHAGQAVIHHGPTLFSGFESAPVRAYLKRYSHEHNLMITDRERSHWLSLYRPETQQQFNEQERRIFSTLMPHLIEALAINRALVLGDPHAVRRASPAGARALIKRDGVFLHCGKRFLDLLRAEWRDWSEARVPAALLSSLLRDGSTRIAAGTIRITAQSCGDALLLHGSTLSVLQRLSPQELAVAREFGAGKDYKTIARETQLAPATVRNVVQHAYRKLAIDNKAALAALFVRESA